MNRLTAVPMTGRRLAGVVLLTALLGPAMVAAGVGPAAANPSAATSAGTFTKTEKISRVNLINNQTQVVDSRTFTVKVDRTRNLRDGDQIGVSWTGAHPTGGIATDETSEQASEEEYPVVLMMCRGSAGATSGKNLVTPETCWTQNPAERVQPAPNSEIGGFPFPPYRLDLYASAADRKASVGLPLKVPRACTSFVTGTQHWVPFIAASGHAYDFGEQGCAGMPPEAQNVENPLAPGSTTYAASDLNGNGSAAFRITTALSNQSLGCSSTVPCTLAVIPIMGISCDPSADSLPPADRPPPDIAARAVQLCTETGKFAAGQMVPAGETGQESLAVSGQLWWSESNWQNRILVPLTFAPPLPNCPLAGAAAQVQVAGSYLMLEAGQQWTPQLCHGSNSFTLEQVVQGEPSAQLQLQQAVTSHQLAPGVPDAVYQAAPPLSPFTGHIVQAPTAVTGFAIVFDIVNQFGKPYTLVRLDARLLAKLLTESYPADSGVQQQYTKLHNPATGQPNPLNMAEDPEFQALNPDIPAATIGKIANVSPATLLAMSGDSDIMWALTSYIEADPEARAWLKGTPDPWGMVVNPAYKGMKLPVAQWPLLDIYPAPSVQLGNPCLAQDPSPFLGLVASPVQAIDQITLDLEFDYSDSQLQCNSAGAFSSLTAVGKEFPGETFIFGVTSLADADRFGLRMASLETQGGSTSSAKFTSASGRSFVAPSDASLAAALRMMKPDNQAGTWTMPYAAMRTAAAGKAAYPGAMLVSTDVPTRGLPNSLARDFNRFLGFASSAGQRPGLSTGQLPPGYLPLTAGNGAAKMVAYTKLAAVDVAAQNGTVPLLNGTQHGTGSHSGTPAPSPGSSGSSSAGGQPTSGSSGGGSPSPSTGNTAKTTTPGANHTQPIATTADLQSTLSGSILPMILLIALIGGTLAYGAWQLTRPVDPK